MLRRIVGLFVCLFAGTLLFAQTDRAVLRGVVKDSSGAAVPTSHITVTEIQTNIQARTLVSDANGNYEVPDLKPTVYSVKADAPGFRTFIAKDVLLEAGQVRRVDITLEVGAATESITVEAGAAVIQTETGSISGELDTAKKYPATPFVDIYPSPFALMTTMPNVQGNGWAMVMSGISDRNKQTYAFDGVPNDTSGDQMDNPNFFETVQVTTVNADVDSGRAGSFNMVSKHGGNDFHGDAYYKNENSTLNAEQRLDSRHQKDPLPVPRIRGASLRTHHQEPYFLLCGLDAPDHSARLQPDPDDADHARTGRRFQPVCHH